MSTLRKLSHRRFRVAVRWAVRVGLVLVVLGAAYVAVVYARHERPVALPAPTGRHPVGRVQYTWTDGSRADPLSPRRPAGPRRLSAFVWFPAAGTVHPAGRAAYLPGAWGELHLPAPVGWAETPFDKVDAHTLAHGRVAHGRFPVVVLLPGLGFAAPQYSSLAVDLASHGYLVVGVTPTYSANLTVLDGHPVRASALGNPSGFSGQHDPASTRTALRLMRVWAQDALFAGRRFRALGEAPAGRFSGHVDSHRVAYVGHSFGGTSALQACLSDRRCAAVADLDGAEFGPVVRRGLRAPLLLIGHQNSCVTALCDAASDSDRVDLSVARRLLNHTEGPAWSVSVDGTGHFDFTDYAAYYLALPLHELLALGSMDGDRALQITGRELSRFLSASFADRPVGRMAVPHSPQTRVRAW